MNLIIVTQEDFIKPGRVRLAGRRFEHLKTILKSTVGDVLSVGELNGKIGQGKITAIDNKSVELDVHFTKTPPKKSNITLIIPMVRPPMFKRMLLTATTLGIKNIHVINFSKVEKSLWTSSSLRPQEIYEQLILGLEQAKDTILPVVSIHQRFKPFVEDVLPAISKNSLKLVAHPSQNPCPHQIKKPVVIIIGPEGGITDSEIALLLKQGFKAVSLEERILRVETALSFLVGRLI